MENSIRQDAPGKVRSATSFGAELTRQAPERIAHTHLKDVDAGLARRVRAGELTYTEAVAIKR